MNALVRLAAALRHVPPPVRVGGALTAVTPSACRVAGLAAHVALGDRVTIEAGAAVVAEVIAIDAGGVTIKPFDAAAALSPGAPVFCDGRPALRPDPSWRGRAIDALGRPIDGLGPLTPGAPRALDAAPPAPLLRRPVGGPVATGVRMVDVFTPLCRGQRVGVFAGSGVGKSTLLGMLARAPGFDAVVVALVGERGREVREFLEGPLAQRRADTVAVVATGDESPMMRRLAARTATAVAESLRDAGLAVLLIVDSVTRFAQACREVGLAAGEPPVARGFPPSVFADLPRLLERAGPSEGAGSITGLYTVLVDGDDHNDPVADAIRGTLDGHIVLDRAIADQGRYPAIDPLRSLSRLADRAWTPDQAAAARRWRARIARYEETRDLRALGGAQPGLDPDLDRAVEEVPRLYAALGQGPADAPCADAFAKVAAIVG